MKEYLKTLLIAGVPFGIIMSLFYSIVNGVNAGIIGGISSGLLFGLLVSVFVQSQKRKFKKVSSEITNGKDVIIDGGANHFIGKESVGGWLFLTKDEIIFKSHGFNFQRHQLTIGLNQISGVNAISTLGFVPNGLEIIALNGNNERFVVNNRRVWIKKINEAIAQTSIEI